MNLVVPEYERYVIVTISGAVLVQVRMSYLATMLAERSTVHSSAQKLLLVQAARSGTNQPADDQ